MSEKLPNMLDNTIAKIREMVDVDAVVGEAITTADGVTIIPISKVSVGFGGGGSGFQGYATRADINEGFALNGLTNGVTAIQQGQKDMIYEMISAIKDCCCTTKQEIADVKYSAAKESCETRHIISDNTRDILENQNTNTRAILDFLTQDKIATLTAENQSLKFQASQTAQNAFITANQEAQTATLLRRLGADCPTPAYVVQPPTPVHFPYNNCGCGGNAYGYAG